MTEENANGPLQADAQSDAEFVGRVLSSLPSVAVPSALEASILAGFDRAAAAGLYRSWLARLSQGMRDAVWPGAPVWKPAVVFALSLIVGLVAGAVVPSSDVLPAAGTVQSQSLAYDTTPALDLAKDL
ncbi:MAG: hypothetical protein KGL29_12500 [Alphaproteobacteria bacterium]|nr:hypothetical protein [Alphaproteobacteria bacterium]